MSLLHRKPSPLGPDRGAYRDDRRILVVACDTYAPEQYFRFLNVHRVHVMVASALPGGGDTPKAALESCRAFRKDPDFIDCDEIWILMDTDHWIEPNHRAAYMDVMKTARQERIRVAVSNPCFDVWLLLHHSDVNPSEHFGRCDRVGERIRRLKGEYNKTSLKRDHYSRELAAIAVQRGRILTPATQLFVPHDPGTQVWALVESILAR